MCCGCVPLPQSLTWVSSWGSARLPPSCKSNYLKYKSNLSYTRDKNNKLVQDLWLLRSVCLPRIFCFTICPVNYTNRVHWCVFWHNPAAFADTTSCKISDFYLNDNKKMLPAEPVCNTKFRGIFRYDSSTSNLLFGYFSRDRQYLYIAPSIPPAVLKLTIFSACGPIVPRHNTTSVSPAATSPLRYFL